VEDKWPANRDRSVIAAMVALLAIRSRKGSPAGMLRCVGANVGGGFLGAIAALNGVVPARCSPNLPRGEATLRHAGCLPVRLRRDRRRDHAHCEVLSTLAFAYMMAWRQVAVAPATQRASPRA
jgi:hypothetical protein